MTEFRRKLYTRGSSYETTLPMPILFNTDLLKKKYEALFTYAEEEKRWYLSIGETKRGAKKSQTVVKRKIYRRGSSYETTLPSPILFKTNPEKKKYDVLFTYDS